MGERPQVRNTRPIRQTQLKPKLLFSLFPIAPGGLTIVIVAWFCLVPKVYVSIPIGALILFGMWMATMVDAFWFEIGTQKFILCCRRHLRTRGRFLFSPRRKYKAAR